MKNFGQLSNDELRKLSPAVFAESNDMSARYTQVPTSQILDVLASADYFPVGVTQDKPRSRCATQVTHAVTLRHRSSLELSAAAEVPQITVLNSHNGRTKLRLLAGFFRVICTNGLTIGDPAFIHAVTHQGDALVESLAFAETITESTDEMRRRVETWKDIQLSRVDARDFASQASILRFGKDRAAAYDPATILEARRDEDKGDDLWRVFNRVQEATVKGGIAGVSENGRALTSRGIKVTRGSIDYNTALWNLADEFAVAA